jgi:predicted MFS family arabinose efflux permease
VLVVVYIFNMVDRNILNILLEPIKAELGVSDTLLGLLIGPAFAIFYTFAGLPIARIADRSSRRAVISIGLAVWSLMTAVSALVRTFPQLLLARIGVGVGEAACSPAAHSLISDYFPPERRATAFSIYALGSPLGALVGFAAGGWIAEFFGWRRALMVVGLPGVAFAVFVWLTLREPRRGTYEQDAPPATSLPEAIRFMSRLPALRHVLLGGAIHSFASVAVASWHAPFLMRVHEMGPGQAGTWLAGLSIFSAIGTFAGGSLSDRLARRDIRWHLWATGFATLAAVPFYLGFYLWPGTGGALALAVPGVLLAAFFFGPVIAVTQSLVRSNMRAVASAVMLFLNNIIGYGLGPLAVGAISDRLAPSLGNQSIRYALLIVIVTNLWATAHFFLGARTLRRDLEAKAAA